MLPQPGLDLRTETQITFQQSYTGAKRTFKIASEETCPVCAGTRSIRRNRCTHCNGRGSLQSERTVQVNIPAGVDDGWDVRVPGGGEPGRFGGAPGNLYVRVTVIPDLRFGRDGADLFVAANVERSIARNGGTIQVAMPDGQLLDVGIPKGKVADGVRVRVRNQGMPIPHQAQRGDLYVSVTIVPDSAPARKPAPAPHAALSPAPSDQAGSGNTAAPAQASRRGMQFGNYRVLRRLGSGGQAEVYLAEHQYLKTLAAIKVLKEQLSPQAEQSFLAEAQTIARLRHPHIVRIFDFGMESGTPYLAMDYAADGTLQDRHDEGEQLPFALIVSYVRQIAEALDYAHGQRVVHRDVKPANMLVEADHLLLSDFGIAVAAHAPDSLVTQEAIGTVAYMAPEQIRKKPRPASDQYALAVVVYEWIVGEPPFTGEAIEVAMSHVSDEPPSLRAKRPDLSLDGESVILRALAKDPDQRFASVGEFAKALQQFL